MWVMKEKYRGFWQKKSRCIFEVPHKSGFFRVFLPENVSVTAKKRVKKRKYHSVAERKEIKWLNSLS